jgi:hypothetical protein
MNPKVLIVLTPLVLAPLVSLVRAENTAEGIPPLISESKPKPEMPIADEDPIACSDLETCEMLLRQAVAELEHWRGTGAEPAPPLPLTGLPSIDALLGAKTAAPSTPTGTPAEAPATPPSELPTPEPPPSAPATPTAPEPSSVTPAPPSFAPEDLPRLAQVASVVKGMKPREAAAVLTQLDEGFAVAVLARLPNRNASALTASLDPQLASRLLARLARLKLEAAASEEEEEAP